MYSNAMDVSHLIDDSDEGQDAHDAMHPDQLLHIARAFAHHAGVGKDPGEYSGPTAAAPADWGNDQDFSEGQDRVAQSESISNLSQSNAPVIPGPAPKAAKPLPVDGRASLAKQFQDWDPSAPGSGS
jgi:hypothetical protein